MENVVQTSSENKMQNGTVKVEDFSRDEGFYSFLSSLQTPGGVQEFRFALSQRMHIEEERRLTLTGLPPRIRKKLGKDLAAAGFFFLKAPDSTMCAFCGVMLRKWSVDLVPLEEHRKNSPDCPFVNGGNVGNIPAPPYTTADERFLEDEAVHAREVLQQASGFVKPGPPTPLGMGRTSYPLNPQFSSQDFRSVSYAFAPEHLKRRWKELAKSGLFFRGFEDYVTCFYCDGSLWNWGDYDDPEVAHAYYYPLCHFLQGVKGPEFIRDIRGFALDDPIPSKMHRISLDEVMNRMDTHVVKTVLDKAVSTALVIRAIFKKYRSSGREFLKAAGLFKAVFKHSDEDELTTNPVMEEPSYCLTGALLE